MWERAFKTHCQQNIMIPKIIHYCWFGCNPIPMNLQSYMDSWKALMPDWEWKRWDEDSFDIRSISWTSEAYDAKKYAFVSDYVRLYALYEYGGLYFDTYVKLKKNLEPLCQRYDAFMGYENNEELTSAVIAMPAHHPLIEKFLVHYKDKHFSQEIVSGNVANVRMMTEICKEQGLLCNDKEQDLKLFAGTADECQVHIYPKTYFCPLDFYHNENFTNNTYAIHYFDASWLDKKTKDRILQERSVWYKATIAVKSVLSKILTLIKR